SDVCSSDLARRARGVLRRKPHENFLKHGAWSFNDASCRRALSSWGSAWRHGGAPRMNPEHPGCFYLGAGLRAIDVDAHDPHGCVEPFEHRIETFAGRVFAQPTLLVSLVRNGLD